VGDAGDGRDRLPRGAAANPPLAKTPVILLTAMSDKRVRGRGGKLGVQDYL
jgi:CheY-like chemotaxis protein